MAKDPHLEKLNRLTLNELTCTLHLKPSDARLFLSDYHSFNPEKMASYYAAKKIRMIGIHEQAYPSMLRCTEDPPLMIYATGRLDLLQQQRSLSVVGTRYPSTEAEQVIRRLIVPLIKSGWTIVSGMAAGVDGMAHRMAINGNTIAVLGSGLLCPYPYQHRDLFRKLCEYQLVISEYPPLSGPARWRFPERNRIISGLTPGTLVIEAKERSGSLITADQALEQGREVFAAPGSILKLNSVGTNRLIQQGAKLVTSFEDILEELTEWKRADDLF
jgi:DNA protecting protein DprA